MDSITQTIIAIAKEGFWLIFGSVALGFVIRPFLSKQLQTKLIPIINAVFCVVFSIIIPTMFSEFDIYTQAIFGLFCALLASLFYDKIISTLINVFDKNQIDRSKKE